VVVQVAGVHQVGDGGQSLPDDQPGQGGVEHDLTGPAMAGSHPVPCRAVDSIRLSIDLAQQGMSSVIIEWSALIHAGLPDQGELEPSLPYRPVQRA
jgi:hypothetical protein